MSDKKIPTIGIIGFGFVGRAIQFGFAQTVPFRIYDVDPIISENTFEETVKESDFIFLCVPTPMDINTGKFDLSIMKDVVDKCVPFVENTDKILILKSTIVPGTTADFVKQYSNVNFVFNPEFLTERTYRNDFINSSRIILGGPSELTQKVHDLYRLRFPAVIPICQTDYTSAEMVKYAANCFFAMKVSMFNEFYEICKALKIDYDQVAEMVVADGRIGNSHIQVPGHDGLRGYSGKCFPKDINAMINRAKELGVDPIMMEASWKRNLKDRPNHDWENIKGATSNKKEEE